jgi:hypothetical protein
MNSIWRVAIGAILGNLSGLFGAVPETHDGFEKGLSIITSREGSPEFLDENGSKRSTALHAIQHVCNTRIRTAKNASLFIVLSNGAVLGIGAETELEVIKFVQVPIESGRESVASEPSLSMLELRLKQGKLAISAHKLSSLSQMTLQLPFGQIQLHSTQALISYESTGVQATVFAGSLTYNFPEGRGREFITAGEHIRISEQSAMLGRVAEFLTDATADSERNSLLIQAAENAGERVAFIADSDEPTIPRPVLIAKPGKFGEPSPRPYRYLVR